MAKSAKTSSVFDDVAVTLVKELKAKDDVVSPEALEEKGRSGDKYVEETNTINTNNTHTHEPATTNIGLNIRPNQKEVKSKRVNLVLQPSVYAKAQAFADRHNVSFNELISQILQQLE